jgi:hypothetical protein
MEEFNRACERRKQDFFLPRIMFYFCEAPIPVPMATEIQQLTEVVKFRSQLASQGLTVSHRSPAEFGDHVRGGLLRAIRDILIETVAAPKPAMLTGGPSSALTRPAGKERPVS